MTDAHAAQPNDIDDPYQLALVKHALHSYAKGYFLSVTLKRIPRLGDCVSIAMLKLLSPDEMLKPETLTPILRVIHDSFLSTEDISSADDRKPSVTLFLLAYLADNAEPELREGIERTAEFVKERTNA
jgi:hypothetical protein